MKDTDNRFVKDVKTREIKTFDSSLTEYFFHRIFRMEEAKQRGGTGSRLFRIREGKVLPRIRTKVERRCSRSSRGVLDGALSPFSASKHAGLLNLRLRAAETFHL